VGLQQAEVGLEVRHVALEAAVGQERLPEAQVVVGLDHRRRTLGLSHPVRRRDLAPEQHVHRVEGIALEVEEVGLEVVQAGLLDQVGVGARGDQVAGASAVEGHDPHGGTGHHRLGFVVQPVVLVVLDDHRTGVRIIGVVEQAQRLSVHVDGGGRWRQDLVAQRPGHERSRRRRLVLVVLVVLELEGHHRLLGHRICRRRCGDGLWGLGIVDVEAEEVCQVDGGSFHAP